MPRLSHSILRHALHENPLLPILLKECHDLQSAKNELRWLKEHAIAQHSARLAARPQWSRSTLNSSLTSSNSTGDAVLGGVPRWQHLLRDYVNRRARGEPLQYILGTQPFGDLGILCKRDVLIPRPETEAYTLKVASLVRKLSQAQAQQISPQCDGLAKEEATLRKLRILDLCTGTGCISLLLYSLLAPNAAISHLGTRSSSISNTGVEILGVDVSTTALELAQENLKHSISTGSLPSEAAADVLFRRADCRNYSSQSLSRFSDFYKSTMECYPSISSLLSEIETQRPRKHLPINNSWDIVISNPPYISPKQYDVGGTTSRSVRLWEPKQALVPARTDRSGLPAGGETLGCDGVDNLVQGDEFYPDLMNIAREVNAKLILFEVGNTQQANRVRNYAAHAFSDAKGETVVEIWRDEGFRDMDHIGASERRDSDQEGDGRAVVVWRGDWASWRLNNDTADQRRKSPEAETQGLKVFRIEDTRLSDHVGTTDYVSRSRAHGVNLGRGGTVLDHADMEMG